VPLLKIKNEKKPEENLIFNPTFEQIFKKAIYYLFWQLKT